MFGVTQRTIQIGSALGWLWPRMRRYRSKFWINTVASAVSAVTTAAFGYLVGPSFAALFSQHGAGSLWSSVSSFMIAILVLAVIRIIATFAQNQSAHVLTESVVKDVRGELFRHLLSLSPSALAQQKRGATSASVIYDVQQLQSLMRVVGVSSFRDWFSIATLAIVAWRMDPWLMSLAAPAFFFALLFAAQVVRRTRKAYVRAWEQTSSLSAAVAETSAFVTVLRSYGATEQSITRFEEQSNNLYERQVQALSLSTLIMPVVQALIVAVFALGVWFSTSNLHPAPKPLSEVVSFYAVLFLMFRPLYGGIYQMQQLSTGLAALDRIKNFISLPTIDATQVVETEPLVEIHSVRVAHVDVGYDTQPILKDLCLEIKRGTLVTVIGNSGAGKTTLLRLLGGQLQPLRGSLYINGVDLSDINVRDLWTKSRWLPQRPYILAASVRDNISLGCDSEDLKAIKLAADKAKASGFIENLQDGYDTMLSEDGLRLSQGEQQRLCLARSLYAMGDLYLFDEPTSALDQETEQSVLDAMRYLRHQDKMVVWATHKQNLLQDADQIWEVKDGTVHVVSKS